MKLAWIAAVALALVFALVAAAAVSYEVLSLGSSLTRIARDLRGGGLPPVPSVPRPARPRPAVPPSTDTLAPRREVGVSFALGQDDLARMLRRDDRWLAGTLTVTREVACRLDGGHVVIETRNRVAVLGVPLGSYPGYSDWALTALLGAVAIRLDELRLADIPIPGASWLVRRFGPSRDGWTVVPTRSTARVERIDVDGGKLHVAGTVRER